MAANVKRLTALGLVPELAAELARQINGAPRNRRRLQALSMVVAVSAEIVRQMQVGIGDADLLADLGVSPELAAEIAAQINGGAPAPYFSVNPSITPTMGAVGQLFTAIDGTVVNGSLSGRRWLLDGVQIGIGTTVTPATAGTLRLENSASGAGGSATALSSPVTVVALSPPSWTVQPSISGTPQQGFLLTGSDGTIVGGTVTARQWRRNGVDIGGATASTYTLQAADVGALITFRVTANGAGGSASATSPATSAILPPAPAWTVQPSISGTAQQGQTLTGSDGTITNGTVSSRQWRRNGADIGGATSSTYLLVSGDVGAVITFRVTATGTGGSNSATSTGTSVVLPLAPSWSVQPSISGTPAVGETLTGADGTIANGTVSGRQWRRDGVNIGGATSSTYLVDAADVGTAITFRVTATGTGGSASATSTAVNIPAGLPAGLLALFNMTDTETMYINIDGTGAHPSANFDRIGRILNIAPGKANPLLAPSDGPRAEYLDLGGLLRTGFYYDGNNKRYNFSLSEATDLTDLTVVWMYRSDKQNVVPISTNNSLEPIHWENGSSANSSSFSGDYYVNGVAYPATTTANAIRAEVATGLMTLFNSNNKDWTGATSIILGTSSDGGNFYTFTVDGSPSTIGDMIGFALIENASPSDITTINNLMYEWAGNPMEITSSSIGYPEDGFEYGSNTLVVEYGVVDTLKVEYFESDGTTPIGSPEYFSTTTSPQSIKTVLPADAQGQNNVRVKVSNDDVPAQNTTRIISRIPYMAGTERTYIPAMGEDYITESTGNYGPKNLIMRGALLAAGPDIPGFGENADLRLMNAEYDGIPKNLYGTVDTLRYQLPAASPAGVYTLLFDSSITVSDFGLSGYTKNIIGPGHWELTKGSDIGGFGYLNVSGNIAGVSGGFNMTLLPKDDPNPELEFYQKEIDNIISSGVEYTRWLQPTSAWSFSRGEYPSDALSAAGTGRIPYQPVAHSFIAQVNKAATDGGPKVVNPYINTIWFAEDSMVLEMANVYNDILNPEQKVAVAFANEIWNFTGYACAYGCRFDSVARGFYINTLTPTPIPLQQGDFSVSTGELFEGYASGDYIMGNFQGAFYAWRANKNNSAGLTDAVAATTNTAWTVIATTSDIENAVLRYQAQRSQEIWDIWESVLGSDRVVRVIETLAVSGFNDLVKTLLSYNNVIERVDYVVTAPYWGNGIGSGLIGIWGNDIPSYNWGPTEQALVETDVPAFKAAFYPAAQMCIDDTLTFHEKWYQDMYDWIATNYDLTLAAHVGFGCYEANNHLKWEGGWPSAIADVSYDMLFEQEWADLYTRYYEGLKKIGGLTTAFLRTANNYGPTEAEKWSFMLDENNTSSLRWQAYCAVNA